MKGNLTKLTIYSDQIAKKINKEYKKDSDHLSCCRWLTGCISGLVAITFTEYRKQVSHSCAHKLSSYYVHTIVEWFSSEFLNWPLLKTWHCSDLLCEVLDYYTEWFMILI